MNAWKTAFSNEHSEHAMKQCYDFNMSVSVTQIMTAHLKRYMKNISLENKLKLMKQTSFQK